MPRRQIMFDTDIGSLYLVADANALLGVHWTSQGLPFPQAQSPQWDILTQAKVQLTEYFSGLRTLFDLPLELRGTDFQKTVWQQLCQIPYGETCSYKDLALAIGDGNATRAVGTANGANPLCIVIPCHRVIASDGTLGGYSGGLAKKRFLLELESRPHKAC